MVNHVVGKLVLQGVGLGLLETAEGAVVLPVSQDKHLGRSEGAPLWLVRAGDVGIGDVEAGKGEEKISIGRMGVSGENSSSYLGLGTLARGCAGTLGKSAASSSSIVGSSEGGGR